MEKYQVREYDQFPYKKGGDQVVREFPSLEEAQFESMYLNRKYDTGRFYIWKNPAKEYVVANDMLEKKWRKALQSCGLTE